MRRTRQDGFTLIELMIAVAILGILTGILVLSFSKPTRKVKSKSEVNAMFAEMHRAQSQYALEHGRYYSTGESADDIYPSTLSEAAQEIDAPEEWTTLRIQPTAQRLMCGYVTIAGTADDELPDVATDFGMEQPAGNWYVLFARCNADNNTAVDGTYFSSSVDATLMSQNDGR